MQSQRVAELSWMGAATWRIQDNLDLLHIVHKLCVWIVHALVLAVGRCRVSLCEKRPKAAPMLDRDSSSRLPMDPPQDTAEPVSQTGGTSRKEYLRKS